MIIKNPNKKLVENIENIMKKNGGYCPCRIEKNKDNKCPCKEFRESKKCCCGLYIEIDK